MTALIMKLITLMMLTMMLMMIMIIIMILIINHHHHYRDRDNDDNFIFQVGLKAYHVIIMFWNTFLVSSVLNDIVNELSELQCME